MSIHKIKNFVMPIILLICVLFSIFFGEYIPYNLKSFFYSISLTIKELLIFFLPFIIFSLVFNSIRKLETNALKFIAIIIPLICFSNFINTILSYMTSILFNWFGMIKSVAKVNQESSLLIPIFPINIPKIISNDSALILGCILGLISGFFKADVFRKISNTFNSFQKYFFKILTPIMPLFIIGTSLKLQHDGMLSTICKDYFPILLVFIISAYGVVLTQFILLSSCNFKKFILYLKNILPAVITGFGSMSSAAALPLSIKAAENNSLNKENAAIIIPATVNVHLAGDCFFIPMISIAVMISFEIDIPTFSNYLIFAFYFMLAKFAIAAVPGGGILVMLPILQKYLGFNTDMLGLITALYILFDPIITACNVAGNGSMAIIFDKILCRTKNTKNSL